MVEVTQTPGRRRRPAGRSRRTRRRCRRGRSTVIPDSRNSLDTLLGQARKCRLSLVLSHHDLAQFPRDLLAATSANARNNTSFPCAPEDARVPARHTLPELDEHDLTHLDAYTAVARLVVDGRQTPAFTMRTRPPKPVVGEAAASRPSATGQVPPQDDSAMDELVERYSHPDRSPSLSRSGERTEPLASFVVTAAPRASAPSAPRAVHQGGGRSSAFC